VAALPFFPNIVDGKERGAADGARIVSVDPASGEQWAEAVSSGPVDVSEATAAAAEAFRAWRRTTPAERSGVLLAAADVLSRNADDLVDLEVRDTGKPRRVMAEEELPACVDQLRFYAGAARMLEGRAVGEYVEGVTSGIRREPIGVCGQVTPWNYPLMMAVWKWAPAVAAGNTVVLKPADLTPASTVRMAQLLADVVPHGVLNVICGGVVTGEHLVADPRVSMVAITGSVRAGRAVATAAAQRLARVHLELGGNAPAVIFADADLAAAVRGVVEGAFLNAGQDCTAAARVLVAADVHDQFLELLTAAVAALRVGAPDEEGVDHGPLVSEAQRIRVLGLLERLPDHATLLVGGQVPDRPGFFLTPGVVAGVRQDDEIVQAEIFGPLVTVQPFAGEAEALELANGVPYGLTASVWTTDHGRAARFLRDLDFGAVSVNVHAPMGSELPHGGFGLSGYGKDLGIYGLEDYTRIKHIAQAF